MAKLTFLKSAASILDFPRDNKIEVAIAGRSNAGKSSLINIMAQSKIAKVSGTPGKTRLLNLFDHEDGYRIVDMPGYGYAARAGKEVQSWGEMVNTYLVGRRNLAAILLIMDIRREWTTDEGMIFDIARDEGLEFGVVLSKADKLTQSAVHTKKTQLSQALMIDAVQPVSNLKRTGIIEVEKILYKWFKSGGREF